MTKAEEMALEAYPVMISEYSDSCQEYDSNESDRLTYQEGYEQAERDIISLIESRLSEIVGDAQPKPILRAELEELINKIKE